MPGVLHAWYRSTTGEWYGLVSFSIMYANRNPSTGLQLEDQLVPADSLLHPDRQSVSDAAELLSRHLRKSQMGPERSAV